MSDTELPLISVILPVYNCERYIELAVISILEQSYQNFQLIIINDGSTDSTADILSKFNDSRIEVVSRKNKGLIFSLNEGVSLSRGSFIARMDADDVSEKNRLQEQYDKMQKDNLDICGCDFRIIDENGIEIGQKSVPTKNFPLVLMTNVPFAHGSVMIRSEFLKLNNLSYQSGKYYKAEDYQFWCDIYDKGGIFGNVSKFLFRYRELKGSLSSDKKNMHHASMISYDFIKKNHDGIVEEIKKDPSSLTDFKNEISFFSLVTIFKDFSFKFSLFPNLKVFLFSVVRMLKLYRIVIMSKFND